MNLIPLGDRVIVKADSLPEEIKSGSIILMPTPNAKPQIGVVIAVGPENKSIAVGDMVMYEKHAGSDIKIGDVEYLIMHESDVYGIFTGE